jgi:tRNA threonylcarbamoyladenosine biosynthesis protein TsaB
MDSPDGYAHVLYGHVEGLLGSVGVRIGNVDCFAAASGPGSFTGVRVGLAAIKGFAEATGKPAVAIPTLEALALHGEGALRAAVLDAHRGEVYGALYDDGLRLISPPIVGPLEPWLASLPKGVIEFVTVRASWLAPLLASTRFSSSVIRETGPALAPGVARLAAQRMRRGHTVDPSGPDAEYVRRSDAEIFWKER